MLNLGVKLQFHPKCKYIPFIIPAPYHHIFLAVRASREGSGVGDKLEVKILQNTGKNKITGKIK